MRAGEPSKTALGAAAHRAAHQVLDEPVIFHDPLAFRILGRSREDVLADAPADSPLRRFIALRHRVAEDVAAAAVARGTRQVVILGAGLDTFAYRNPGVPTYEVDFPATGAWKRARLAEAGIAIPPSVRYVGVDFERDNLGARLAGEGFDPHAPAAVLWLGVVVYLTRDAVAATLRTFGHVEGTELVFDYSSPSTDPARAAARRELADRVAAHGEAFTEQWQPAELHAVLAAHGFDVVSDRGRPDGGGHVIHVRAGRRARRA